MKAASSAKIEPHLFHEHRIPPPQKNPGSHMRCNMLATEATALDELWAESSGTSWRRSDGWAERERNLYNVHGVRTTDVVESLELKKRRTNKGTAQEERRRRVLRIALPANGLRGELIAFPRALSELVRLVELDLCDNNLAGDLLKWIGGCSSLEIVRASHNSLSGGIPDSVCSLRNLRELHVNDNALGGTITTQLGELTRLEVFCAQCNALQGSLPSSMSRCAALRIARLQNNKLSGELPYFIGFCRKLHTLDVRFNRLAGPLPESLGLFTDGRGGGVLECLLLDGNVELLRSLPETLHMFIADTWYEREYGCAISPTRKITLYYDGAIHSKIEPVVAMQRVIRFRSAVRVMMARLRAFRAAQAAKAAFKQASIAAIYARKASNVAARHVSALEAAIEREKRDAFRALLRKEQAAKDAARADAKWFNSLTPQQQRRIRYHKLVRKARLWREARRRELAPVLRQAARVKRKLANMLESRRAQRVAGACRAGWRRMRAAVQRKESRRRRRPLGRVVMVTPAAADADSSTECTAAAAAASAKAAEEERSAYRGLML